MAFVSIEEAIQKLSNQDVVALPTETVYGLAGQIDNEDSLHKIFSTKARPFYDPLIVHVKSLDQALGLGVWDELSQSLASYFWPGPLTIVVPKTSQVSNLITSGGPTVAFRQPDHKLFQEVLNGLNHPVAAPSANMFGQTSPTTAEHVLNEFDHKVSVLDGGPCEKGIESTVIEVSAKEKIIKILRPGFIGTKELKQFLSDQKIEAKVTFAKQDNAPGHLKNHYQPSSPLFLVSGTESAPDLLIDLMSREINQPLKEWRLPNEPSLAARNLYKDLRVFSQNNQASFLLIKKEWEDVELWKSILDRLNKAAHYLVSPNEDRWLLKEKNKED